MSNEYIDEFFEGLYNADVAQKHQLDSADSFVVGIFVALVGAGAYLIQLLAKTDTSSATQWLWFMATPYAVALVGALGCVIWSIWPRIREYVSSPQQWAEYVREFDAYYEYFHKDPDDPERSKKVASELRKLRRQQYISAGETNRKLIYQKHASQTWAKRCLIAAVVFLLFMSFPIYYVHKAEARKDKDAKSTKPAATTPATNSNPTTTPGTPVPAGQPTTTPNSTDRRSDNGRGIEPKETITKGVSMPGSDSAGPNPAQPATPSSPPPKPVPPGTTKVKADRVLGDPTVSKPKAPPIPPPGSKSKR